jgi:hypothetical protein
VGLSEPPVRLCCGQRHFGLLCPDGKIMCCLCFDRFALSELSQSPDAEGVKEDVCADCAASERKWNT